MKVETNFTEENLRRTYSFISKNKLKINNNFKQEYEVKIIYMQ